MNEHAWLTCTDPAAMLECVHESAPDGKLRLFAVACARQVWGLLADPRSRQSVEAAEEYAAGLTTGDALQEANREADDAQFAIWTSIPGAMEERRHKPNWVASLWAKVGTEKDPHNYLKVNGPDLGTLIPAPAQVRFLRDIFGNPLRPVSLHPDWLTPTVIGLATAAHEHRSLPSGELDPSRLAVLADALEDAGCTDDAILGHLRGTGPHVRGCWLVDLVLGKS